MTRPSIDQDRPKFDAGKTVAVDDASTDTDDRAFLVLATGSVQVTHLPPRQRDIATVDEGGETATSGGIGDAHVRRRRPGVVES